MMTNVIHPLYAYLFKTFSSTIRLSQGKLMIPSCKKRLFSKIYG